MNATVVTSMNGSHIGRRIEPNTEFPRYADEDVYIVSIHHRQDRKVVIRWGTVVKTTNTDLSGAKLYKKTWDVSYFPNIELRLV